MEKWIVKNNSGTMLNLPKCGIFFKKADEVLDLVNHTGRTVSDLENDPELRKNFSYNNILTIEKVKFTPEAISDSESLQTLSKKLDILTEYISKKTENNDQIDMSKIEDIVKKGLFGLSSNIVLNNDTRNNEEEEMRQDALKKLIDNSSASEKNLENFGSKKREIEDHDDFSDMIDF